MDKKKTVIRVGAALVVALAAGHLVQTMNAERGETASAQVTDVTTVSAGAEELAANPAIPAAASLTAPAPVAEAAAPQIEISAPETADAANDMPQEPILAALPDLPPSAVPEPRDTLPSMAETGTDEPQPTATDPAAMPEVAALSDPIIAPALPDLPAVSAEDCALDMALTAGPQSMISVSITAPCRAGERVVLRHAGLAVAETLSDTGTLMLDFPALNATGDVSVLFPDAEVLRNVVVMPDAAKVRRFAVQWMADDAFQLHAFENGADYGDAGDVNADAPVSPNGGYMVTLGNPGLDFPMLAQVYTWPADPAVSVDVVIEAAVTETTCARELLGEVVQAKAGEVTINDLTLAMPECDAVGDILVLNNPGQDVTLAAN
ncbi:MAG: hypothetical protein WAT09_08285 [Paracoccaceae bacterium]